jgi:hypothetical protein
MSIPAAILLPPLKYVRDRMLAVLLFVLICACEHSVKHEQDSKDECGRFLVCVGANHWPRSSNVTVPIESQESLLSAIRSDANLKNASLFVFSIS